MELLQWSSKFSVGIAKIDTQHQKLFSMINMLITSMSNQDDTTSLSWLVEDLISYVHYHFSSEENYLRAHPMYSSHCQEHHAFTTKIKEFELAKSDQTSLKPDVFAFLVSWLSDHVLARDRAHFRDLGYLL